MLLWLAMLLVADLADEEPTLLAVCIFENDPIELTGGAGAARAAVAVVAMAVLVVMAVVVVVPAGSTAPVSADGVFSPSNQYVVTLPLPCATKTKVPH